MMIQKRYTVLFFIFFCIGLTLHSATINKTLYINRGELTTIYSSHLPYFAFNPTPQYVSQGEVIQMTTNDVLILKIINTDSITHGFNIKRYTMVNATINPKDSIVDT